MRAIETAFPVGAALDWKGVRITEWLGGERWNGRYRGQTADGAPVVVTTSGTQTVPLGELSATLTMKGPRIAALRHIGGLQGNDPHAHKIHAMVEDQPKGQPLSERQLPLGPAEGLALARDLGRLLLTAHQQDVVLGELPIELIYVEPRSSSLAVSALLPRAPRFWRTGTQPCFGLPDPFRYPCLSPEVAWGKQPQRASDAYLLALHAVLWLTGSFPFAGKSYGHRLMRMQMNSLENFDLPGPLRQLLVRALEVDIAQRLPLEELVEGLTAAPSF